MNFEGDLQAVQLALVLQRVSADACTGILTVQGAEDIVAVSLLSGKIVAADSFNQTLEDGLGDVLVEQGVLSKADFDAAVADHPGGSAGSLGDLLVQRSLIGRDQLLQGLRLQTYRLMLQVLSWQTGEFKFYVGDEVSYEDGFQAISVEELLLRAVQERAGEVEMPSLDAVYSRIPSPRPIQVLGREGDGSANGLWLTAPQIEFLERLDGSQSAARIAESRGLDRYQATFYLQRLVSAGLIEVQAQARAATSAPSLVDLPLSPQDTGDLQAEIFLPPDPGGTVGLGREDSQDIAAPARLPDSVRWLPVGLAAVLAFLLCAGLFQRPDYFLLPFPWQDVPRETFARQLRESLFLKIDRAAKSFFLYQAHYPDRIEEMVDQGLLARADLHDPTGFRLSYEADELRYKVTPVLGVGTDAEGLELSESITGDFLLDPQFTPPNSLEQDPLYLIN